MPDQQSIVAHYALASAPPGPLASGRGRASVRPVFGA